MVRCVRLRKALSSLVCNVWLCASSVRLTGESQLRSVCGHADMFELMETKLGGFAGSYNSLSNLGPRQFGELCPTQSLRRP